MKDSLQLPVPLPYPKLMNFDEMPDLKEKFCYVFKAYPQNGFSTTIVRGNDTVCVRIADWTGQLLDPVQVEADPVVSEIMTAHHPKILQYMKITGIPKAMFYYSNDAGAPRLVDMRLSANKFCGPGYLADFFGKMGIPIQQRVGDPVFMKPDQIDLIRKKTGVYSYESYIIKPSAFKFTVHGEDVIPMYGVLKV